jgi:hypothetical protein
MDYQHLWSLLTSANVYGVDRVDHIKMADDLKSNKSTRGLGDRAIEDYRSHMSSFVGVSVEYTLF